MKGSMPVCILRFSLDVCSWGVCLCLHSWPPTLECWCHCCPIIAAAKPGRHDSGGKLDCRVHKRVLNAGGAICAAAVATWACVLMCGGVFIVDSALCSCAARWLHMCSRLMVSVGGVVGLLVDALGTLGNGVIMFIEHVIGLWSSLWGMGIFTVIWTLKTCCVGGLSVCVAMCSDLSGCALICACDASTICCRSVAAGECLSLPVMHWMALCNQPWPCVCDGGISDAFVLESHSVGHALAFGHVKRYHPSTKWNSQVPHLSVFSCTCVLHPIGVSGILL